MNLYITVADGNKLVHKLLLLFFIFVIVNYLKLIFIIVNYLRLFFILNK